MNVKSKSIIISLAVNAYDIDAAGHVNNIVYVRWLEDLRVELFSNIMDFRKLYMDGYYLVVISTEIKYRRQIKIFDEPIAEMEFAGHNHGVIYLRANIKLGNKVCVSASQRCVMMNLRTGRMMPAETISRLLK